ncbi:hypothetical protein BHE74_00019954 [Ensete ventricosum]|uniref:Uncharacterized protein n=1 Tax=Ensete ventricosum TaxID=4639 RepID=A0A444FY11_ENSVE|nr:hypothetical protein B296_00016993 [Ensete ventricosum]RWW27512.1 hypothetical protein GW17_00008055 [Ensete ventricosum]RWW72245.1 hypothetical protein BHE74_00019954 [Ensete ventricosum]RZS01535.1 hypothetical protein BHM03_00031405 [Ensete ventricosum]
MEQHDLALAFVRVHVLDLCPRKASCFRSMFHLLYRHPSCGLGNSLCFTQLTSPLDLHSVDGGLHAHHSTG